MASSLSAAFTAIANAIRAKKGVSTTYTPDDMPDAIASIATATLQTKTTTVTPSANWSGTNTNNATITPDSGYDGMSQVNVNVPMLRDYTLMTADTVDTPGTVYNGNTSESNSQKLLRMKPTKDGMSYTGSYLYMKPNSYLGNASASDVLSGKTFSSSNGIQMAGTASAGATCETIWEGALDAVYPVGQGIFFTKSGLDYDALIIICRNNLDASTIEYPKIALVSPSEYYDVYHIPFPGKIISTGHNFFTLIRGMNYVGSDNVLYWDNTYEIYTGNIYDNTYINPIKVIGVKNLVY